MRAAAASASTATSAVRRLHVQSAWAATRAATWVATSGGRPPAPGSGAGAPTGFEVWGRRRMVCSMRPGAGFKPQGYNKRMPRWWDRGRRRRQRRRRQRRRQRRRRQRRRGHRGGRAVRPARAGLRGPRVGRPGVAVAVPGRGAGPAGRPRGAAGAVRVRRVRRGRRPARVAAPAGRRGLHLAPMRTPSERRLRRDGPRSGPAPPGFLPALAPGSGWAPRAWFYPPDAAMRPAGPSPAQSHGGLLNQAPPGPGFRGDPRMPFPYPAADGPFAAAAAGRDPTAADADAWAALERRGPPPAGWAGPLAAARAPDGTIHAGRPAAGTADLLRSSDRAGYGWATGGPPDAPGGPGRGARVGRRLHGLTAGGPATAGAARRRCARPAAARRRPRGGPGRPRRRPWRRLGGGPRRPGGSPAAAWRRPSDGLAAARRRPRGGPGGEPNAGPAPALLAGPPRIEPGGRRRGHTIDNPMSASEETTRRIVHEEMQAAAADLAAGSRASWTSRPRRSPR